MRKALSGNETCVCLNPTDPVEIKVVDLQQLEEAAQLSSDNFAAGLDLRIC